MDFSLKICPPVKFSQCSYAFCFKHGGSDVNKVLCAWEILVEIPQERGGQGNRKQQKCQINPNQEKNLLN